MKTAHHRNSFRIVFLFLLFSSTVFAKENIGGGLSPDREARYHKLATDCNDATSQIDLDINNVRARLLGAGDFWWDLNAGAYIVPKVDPTTGAIEVGSMFAGALWIGGIDAGGSLKMAAQTYRQSGNDFWPGPLDDQGSVDQSVCSAYDRHWKIQRSEIDDYLALAAAGTPVPLGSIPTSILEWPAKGNPYAKGKNNVSLTIDRNLAPFEDVDADGIYDPVQGDFPLVEGDQAIFWVYNDMGNIHSETDGEAIGLEVQALAFGFQTSDEINDMTFYKYRVLNFASTALDSTYFGVWVDPDLGDATDDFVGCDTALELGYCYNGDAVDGPSTPNYGAAPPIVGTDFFKGPTETFINAQGELETVELGMSSFLFYDNDFSATGNPQVAAHYYNYLSGSWTDGSPFTFGGNGYGGSEPFPFMFPDDPSLSAPAWSECSSGNTPADRRYLQSSGAFRLEPGAQNEIIIGVVWVPQASQTGCAADIDLLKAADQKAQALFDADFELIDGPDAPDLEVRELDQEIIINLTNGPTSNNAAEQYEAADPVIVSIVQGDATGTITDSTYNFEGYILYQLADAQVSPAEFNDPDRARIVAQVDVRNDVDLLVNLEFDADLGVDVPELMVDGNNGGIRHSFNVTEDLFAEADKDLVNYRTYYFAAVAYAFNDYLPYDPSDPQSQRRPYLQGRKNVKVYSAIPHIPTPENYGTVLGSAWGDGPELTRLEGMGNARQVLEITAESETRVLSDGFDPEITYKGRSGPVDVMVADPLKVPNADFELRFSDPSGTSEGPLSATSTWTLSNLSTGESISSDGDLSRFNEQLLEAWGLTVSTQQEELLLPDGEVLAGYPGGLCRDLDDDDDTPPTFLERSEQNGLLEVSREYERNSLAWMTGLSDADGSLFQDWIVAGITEDDESCVDDNQYYETLLEGTWTAGALIRANDPFSIIQNVPPAYNATNDMEELHSVDLVFTSDKSRWTRSPVVEGSENGLSDYDKSALKLEPGLNRDGEPDGSLGRSWFPGYAIDLATGERLNIVFAEASFLAGENGNDMLWNPTSTQYDPTFNPIFGGMHHVFVLKSRYDEGEDFFNKLASGTAGERLDAWNDVMWAGTPVLLPGTRLESLQDGLIPTETRIRFRVAQPYARQVITGENAGQNMYRFSTKDLAPRFEVFAAASSACDLINVVPNPYYAFSEYETSVLDNRIKITNLPPRARVSIFSLDGTLVRRFDRDVPADNTAGAPLNLGQNNLETSLEWDLNNSKDIPVASGVYLMHVEAEGLCERTLKFVMIARPVDLDTF